VIPGFAGKDLKKSKKYFEKAMKLGPEYYGTKVLMAETYYVEKEDEKEFKKLLNEVISDSSQDNHPELGPENRMEKIKAKKLLDNKDDLF
jgi:tetratricopeptide (TPR) repeat protein